MSTRKIIDPKQNGEKVWLKGHAKAIYMSDGSTVEDTINSIEVPSLDEYVTETELSNKGFLTEHQDISHLASRNWVETQGYAHQEDLLEISFNDIQNSPISIDDSGMINFVDETGNVGFQINEEGLRVTDVIAGEHKLSEKANVSDIPSLDDYASKEWVNNKNYATEYDLKTIDYSTINNVPVSEDETGELNITDESGNIGMRVASEAVYAKDFVAGEHKLSEKVDIANMSTINGQSLINGGDIVIGGGTMDTSNFATKTELAQKQDAISDLETIRQGAAKGATALQSYTEQYKGTVTGVKINGTTKNPSNGVVDLGTVITSHQDISGKQDALVSGTNIKTINGESILGSGDIVIGGSGKKVVINNSEIVQFGGGADSLTPNAITICPIAYYITFETEIGVPQPSNWDGLSSGDVVEYTLHFNGNVELDIPNDFYWANGVQPELDENAYYELSILGTKINGNYIYKACLTPFKQIL